MTSVYSTTHFTRNPDLIAADMDGDLVMMSIDLGEYFGITGVGTRIWELLAQPTTVIDISRVICSECAVEEATCQADVRAFVEDLIQLGLVSTA